MEGKNELRMNISSNRKEGCRRKASKCLRTTSLLERDIKEFHRRARPMDGFFTAIWVKIRNLERQGKDYSKMLDCIKGGY